jgi:outer membrane autotransporter protein
MGGNSSNGAAQGNSVVINDGTVGGNVYGGYSSSGSVLNNSVIINGGTVSGDVNGGSATNAGPSALNNSVTITGGTVSGGVYGGFLVHNPNTGNATGNTVTISGSPTLTSSALYGGYTGGTGDVFTGNTLNVHNYSGSSVASVQNFQFFNFRIPSTQSGPVLSMTGTATLGDGVTGATVDVNIEDSGRPSLQAGQQFTLMEAGSLSGTLANTSTGSSKVRWMQGVSLLHEHELGFDLEMTATELLATVNTSKTTTALNPQTKSLSEGNLAGTALVNQTTDFLAGKGIPWAKTASGGAGYGFGFFGGLSGGWSRYDTGSHVDVSGLSLIAGLAWGTDADPGRLTLGAFLEYGYGSYDTYNSFSNAASVHGDGDVYHIGGGVLGRFDANCGGYLEASARMGSVTNEYKGRDLRDSLGRSANYDSDALYYGLHAGLGYVWQFTDKASLDLYGKYFWTRQQGDSVTLSTGEPVKFKDADSSRVRIGSRLAYALSACVSPYVGAAWEHEFDGRAKAATNGFDIAAPSLRGDTGIGELGLTLKPSTTLPLSFDVGVQGYAGKREGVTGSLQVRFEF